jgi:Family of unknown function (DUF5947)
VTVVEHPLAPLRRAVERGRQVRAGERCEMCAVVIASQHRHVVDTGERSIKCLCHPCFMLFSDGAAARGRYRQVPTRCVALASDGIEAGVWDALAIPVSLAFFFHSSANDRPVAFYPGPAGATESLLPLDAWQELLDRNPTFASTSPDVEAVMVRREGDRADCFIVPIDLCYELVGRLRMHWSGFDGGAEARAEIEEFFARVRERAGHA